MRSLPRIGLLVVVLALGAGWPAQAGVLTFDDLPPVVDEAPMVPGYGGFTWSNFHYVNQTAFPNSGYDNGTVSGDYMGFNGGQNPASISGSPFDLQGAYLVSAWRDDLQLLVEGSLGGSTVYSQTLNLNPDGPTWVDFDYLNIDTVTFTPYGGTPHPGYSFSGAYFAIDDLTTAPAVPEPGTMGLVLLGACAVGARRRRR